MSNKKDHKQDENDTKILEKVEDMEKTKKLKKCSEESIASIDDANSEETKEVEKIEDLPLEKEGTIIDEDTDTFNKVTKGSKETINDKSTSKKTNKKNVFTIILICIIFILFVALIFSLNKEQKKEKKDTDKDKDTTDIVLTEDDKKKMITSYGKALENVIALSYQKDQVLLKFEEANKLVKIKDDIICSIHEIYDDGKIYLSSCSVNGKMTKYSYGEKQEPKELFDSETMLKVYVNRMTNERSFTIPNNTENVDEYTVHCDGVYESPTLLGFSDYVFYYDSNYNVQMKNFKTDKKALEGMKYSSILPFINKNQYDTKYVAVSDGNKWGIYDLETTKAVIAPIYDYVVVNLNMGTAGPPISISTIKGTNIAVCKNGKYGVINYTNGKEIIPINNDTLQLSGNYLWATSNAENTIYDFSGNKYLTEGYDKIYGISAGTYVLVEQDENIKLIQMDGKVLYEYGKAKKLGPLNFALDYNGGALFQFYKENMQDPMCIEYSYDPDSNTGETKEIECGGLAKPILYLYPKEKTDVTVSFEHPEFLETTYPKFNNYWKVSADTNGDLLDKDNKYYYALYWDEKKVHSVDFSEGFYVEKDDAINFLEEKLSYIGLNDKEKNEFIMYWLPVLENNGKSLVYFELTEERESYNKLLINPKPDSMLRLVIHIKKVDSKTNIKKETLSKFKRSGFTVVEWGGTTY